MTGRSWMWVGPSYRGLSALLLIECRWDVAGFAAFWFSLGPEMGGGCMQVGRADMRLTLPSSVVASTGETVHMITAALGCGSFLDPGIRDSVGRYLYIWQDPSSLKPPLPLPPPLRRPPPPLKKSPTTTASHLPAQMSRCTTPVAMDSIEEDFVLVDRVDIEGLSATPHLSFLPGA